MKQALERRMGAIVGFALALLFLIGVAQIEMAIKLVGASHQVAQTDEALEQLAFTQSLLSDARAETRDYAATGDDDDLELYRTAVLRIPAVLRSLRKLTGADPSQRKNLDALSSLAAAQLADLQTVVEARKEAGLSGAGPLSGMQTSLKAAEAVRQAIHVTKDEERRLRGQRNGALRVTARETTVISTVGSALGLWVVILAGLVIRHYVAERRRARIDKTLSTRLLQNLTDGVYLWDESGIILYANPAGEAMVGYGPGELVGAHANLLADFPAAGENIRLLDWIHEHVRVGDNWKGELATRRKDGAPLATHARINALEIGGGLHWVLVQEDVTQRDAVEERLALRGI